MEKQVLTVEDNKETLAMIMAALDSEGYTALGAETLKDGLAIAESRRPCLIILDLKLPDGDGLELCVKLRASRKLSMTPIIALTGEDKLPQKRKGFDCGLDQYLIKPIEVEELLMWVRALLRRTGLGSGTPMTESTFEDVKINQDTHMVKFRGQTICDLTKRELELFTVLITSAPRVFTREEIISIAWKTAAVPNLVDTHIYNLRKKLPAGLAARLQSVPGRGFRYFSPKVC